MEKPIQMWWGVKTVTSDVKVFPYTGPSDIELAEKRKYPLIVGPFFASNEAHAITIMKLAISKEYSKTI